MIDYTIRTDSGRSIEVASATKTGLLAQPFKSQQQQSNQNNSQNLFKKILPSYSDRRPIANESGEVIKITSPTSTVIKTVHQKYLVTSAREGYAPLNCYLGDCFSTSDDFLCSFKSKIFQFRPGNPGLRHIWSGL